MTQAGEFDGLDEILKIPSDKQHLTVIEKLQTRRKVLADIFFSKTASKEERIKVQDELAKLHDYFKYKPIQKIGQGKSSNWKPITPEERETNCNNFLAYLSNHGLGDSSDESKVYALAHIWGPPR